MEIPSSWRLISLSVATVLVGLLILSSLPLLRVSPQLYKQKRVSLDIAKQTSLGKHVSKLKPLHLSPTSRMSRAFLPVGRASSRASSHPRLSLAPRLPLVASTIQSQLLDWVREGAPRVPFYKVLSPQLSRACRGCHQDADLSFRRVQAAARLPQVPRPHTWRSLLQMQSSVVVWAILLGALLWILPILSDAWRWTASLLPLFVALFVAFLSQRFSPFEVPHLLRFSSVTLIVWSVVVWLRLLFASLR